MAAHLLSLRISCYNDHLHNCGTNPLGYPSDLAAIVVNVSHLSTIWPLFPQRFFTPIDINETVSMTSFFFFSLSSPGLQKRANIELFSLLGPWTACLENTIFGLQFLFVLEL